MDRFIIYDKCLCRRKERGLKHYIDLSRYSDETRQEVVDTLNNNYNDVAIVKRLGMRKLSFLVRDRVYLEQWWVNEMHDYSVHLYVLPKESRDLVIPPMVSEHHYLNIFNECEVVEAWPEEYYVIKCDSNGNVYVVDRHNVECVNVGLVFEKYNIFEGKHIVVDLESFIGGGYVKESGLVDLDLIRTVITNKYKISYVNKILIKKNLMSKDFRHFVEKCHCSLHSVWSDETHKRFDFFIVDNLGEHYELRVDFNDDGRESHFKFVKRGLNV